MSTARKTAREMFEETFGPGRRHVLPSEGDRPECIVELRGTAVLVTLPNKPGRLSSPEEGGTVPHGP